MTNFIGTLGPDLFTGADFVADKFFFTPETLSGLDVVAGGDGEVVDLLLLTAPGLVKSKVYSGVTGIETIRLHFLDSEVVLPDSLPATANGKRIVIDGDSGNDIVNAAAFKAGHVLSAKGGFGNDTVRGGAGDDALRGEGGSDLLTGGPGGDYLSGGLDSDILVAAGADTILGGGGNDVIRFKSAGDVGRAVLANGGDGLDTIELQAKGNYFFGNNYFNIDQVVLTDDVGGINLTFGKKVGNTANADRFQGLEVDLNGPFTNDLFIDASRFEDAQGLRTGGFRLAEIPHNNGNDIFLGGNGRDILYGQGGNDHLTGNNGGDFLDGGLGFDILNGGAGADNMIDGGGGANFIIGRPLEQSEFIDPENILEDLIAGSGETGSFDTVILKRGGSYDLEFAVNIDAVQLDDLTRGYSISLPAGSDANQDFLAGDLLVRPSGVMEAGVRLFANKAGTLHLEDPDLFAGDDEIFGTEGDDAISTGPGADFIQGDRGADALNGGAGPDTFEISSIFHSQEATGLFDRVTNFSDEDTIRIDLGPLAGTRRVLVRPDGGFPVALDADFFRKGDKVYAVAVQSDGIDTRLFVNAQPSPLSAAYDPFDLFGSVMIEFAGNVKAFLDSKDDYLILN